MRPPSALAALAGLLATSPARADIEYRANDSGIATVGAGGRASFRATVSPGDGGYLVVALALSNTSGSIAGVTYAGTPMTSLGMQPGGSECRIYLFGLAGAAPGTGEVSASVMGAPRAAFGVFDFTGVDPALPTGPFVSRAGSSGQPAITVAHPAGQWLIVHACHLDGAGVVQSNYAVTRTDGFAFTGAAGAWASDAVTLLLAATADAGARPLPLPWMPPAIAVSGPGFDRRTDESR